MKRGAQEFSTLSEEAFSNKKSRGKKRGNKKGGQKGQQQSLSAFFNPNPQHRKVTSFQPDEEMKDEEERKEPATQAQQQPQTSCWQGLDLNSLIKSPDTEAAATSNQNKNQIEKPLPQGKMNRIILWFRNDLRMHDNPVLAWAMKNAHPATQIIPVFCFDPRFYTKRQPQFMMARKAGVHRTRFAIESVQDFRSSLQGIGSGLLVAQAKPEDFIPQLVKPEVPTTVVFAAETCSEEREVEDNLEMAMKNEGACNFVDLWGNTLLHIDDVPQKLWDRFPTSATAFMRMTDNTPIRPLCHTPKYGQLPALEASSDLEAQAMEFMPDLVRDFNFKEQEVTSTPDQRTCLDFKGGEKAALERVHHYLFGKKCLKTYKKTRNGMIGADYSSKFSPWLANGTLSVRKVYYDILEFEKQVAKNDSTAHFYFELRWREFYRFYCENHQTKVFWQTGIRPEGVTGFSWRSDTELIQRWKQGMTGMPIVDAFMRELNATGFMSNRGRQIVAAYLALDLQQDWRYGAHHFEEMLLDHDVHSNYGGWNSAAGVGPGRVNWMNALKQSHTYDRQGEFIRLWVPELARVPQNYIHDPWNMPRGQRKMLKLTIGDQLEPGCEVSYPAPIKVGKYLRPDAMQQITGKGNENSD